MKEIRVILVSEYKCFGFVLRDLSEFFGINLWDKIGFECGSVKKRISFVWIDTERMM